jgi:phage terminase large subunit-like protein
LRLLRQLGQSKCERLLHDWRFWGRPEQQWYPDTLYTVLTAGRGWGKTRFGSEQIHLMADERIELCGGEMVVAGRTFDDTMRVLVHGQSGILKTQKPWNPVFLKGKELRWPRTDAVAYLCSGDKPAGFRGPNPGFLLADEFAHWKYPQECRDAFEFSVRSGSKPSIIVSSTPLPHPAFVKLLADKRTTRIRGLTKHNIMNIDPATLRGWLDLYGSTELGKQELEGEVLDGSAHALWKIEDIQRIEIHECPGLFRTVVAIDPAGSKHKKSDKTGIVVLAIDDDGNDYVLAATSGKWSPDDIKDKNGSVIEAGWGSRAIQLARYHGADCIVGERNYGGDMVMAIVRMHPDWPAAANDGICLKDVVAIESKGNRAMPPSQAYKHRRAYHVGDPRNFTVLEYEQTHFDPQIPRGRQDSPNEMDALVHAWAELHPDREGLGGSSDWSAGATEEFEKMLQSIL